MHPTQSARQPPTAALPSPGRGSAGRTCSTPCRRGLHCPRRRGFDGLCHRLCGAGPPPPEPRYSSTSSAGCAAISMPCMLCRGVALIMMSAGHGRVQALHCGGAPHMDVPRHSLAGTLRPRSHEFVQSGGFAGSVCLPNRPEADQRSAQLQGASPAARRTMTRPRSGTCPPTCAPALCSQCA